jgi:hypothetical protein
MAIMDVVLRVLSVMVSSSMAYSVMVLGEDLNRRLETLLKAFFLHDRKSVDKLFAESRPLGTFYSRIEMAGALGLISDDERRDLNLL